jgi:hypothetical protein
MVTFRTLGRQVGLGSVGADDDGSRPAKGVDRYLTARTGRATAIWRRHRFRGG